MENTLQKRKPIRWQGFDYSRAGGYFLTICTEHRENFLSHIVGKATVAANDNVLLVGEGLAPPEIKLTPCGKIAQEQLLLLERRYPQITIDQYVIMPNHIHMILFLRELAGGASPSPTVSDIMCSFKSLTTRFCKQKCGIDKLFQRSFIDHVIRDRKDYETRAKYICENPMRWYYDELYRE